MTGAAKKKQNAYNALESWMDQRPQTNSAYESALDAAVNALEGLGGKQSFSSGYSAGTDPNARAWRQDYAASLTNGANTAAAQTAALSGGYGADYAASAANQTAQLAAPRGIDVEQMLRSLASGGYKANAAANQAAVDAMLADLTLAQSADQMNQDNWAAYRDILAGQASAAADEELGFWGNLWSTAKQLAQAGMDIYDGVKGYQQQDFENQMAIIEALYGMDRDRVEDEQYSKEQAAEAAYRAWQQKMAEEELGLSKIAAQDDHAYKVAQTDALKQDMALAAQAAAAGYGSGGSGGLSLDDLLKLSSAYSEAKLTGDDAMAAFYSGLLADYGFPVGGTGTGGGTYTPSGTAGGSGSSAVRTYTPMSQTILSEAALPSSVRNGVALARGYIQKGATMNDVMMNLIEQGYSDQEVAAIMNVVGG